MGASNGADAELGPSSGHLGRAWEAAVIVVFLAVFGAVIGVAIWHIRRKRRQRRAEQDARDEEEGTAVESVQTMVYGDKDSRREKEKVSSSSRPHSRREERSSSKRNSGSRPHSRREERDRGSRPHSQRTSRRGSPSERHTRADHHRRDDQRTSSSRKASPSERKPHTRPRRDSPTTEDELEAEKRDRLTYEYVEKGGNVAKKSEELEKLASAVSPLSLSSIPKPQPLKTADHHKHALDHDPCTPSLDEGRRPSSRER